MCVATPRNYSDLSWIIPSSLKLVCLGFTTWKSFRSIYACPGARKTLREYIYLELEAIICAKSTMPSQGVISQTSQKF
jgi:hypothetical protein